MKRPIVPQGVTLAVTLAILAAIAPTQALAADVPFELKDGDRVVLIGGTLVEREQATGYLETRLIRRFPDRNLTFRNLGWSGDTVEGVSQAGFGPVEDGFKHLVEHVLSLKPTVLIVGFGANESFEGAAGLPKFLQGFEKLLKAVEPAKARLVFLSPTRQEDLGPPLPDPSRHNAELALYRDAIEAEAEKRGAAFVDLFRFLPDGSKADPRRPLTTNGIHFSPYGYHRLASVIDTRLIGLKFASNWGRSDLGAVKVSHAADIRNWGKVPGGFRFEMLDSSLPVPRPPDGAAEQPTEGRVISAIKLDPGRYLLKVDGFILASATDADWKAGVAIQHGPEFDQVEALRAAVVAKNELYFYRWRPQNETYLFGFRKHEQGKNAREIPLFDPLIAAKEAEIARLRVPVPHTYELIREGEVGQ